MAEVSVTPIARHDLARLIVSLQLPPDTKDRVRATLQILERFPEAGPQLTGGWRECRALAGPWRWLIVVYRYFETDDRVVVIAFHDAKSASSAK